MATPYKLLIHKKDPWTVKVKKRVARWLWEDLTRRQDYPEPAEGYPGATPPPRRLLDSFDIRKHFKDALKKAREDERSVKCAERKKRKLLAVKVVLSPAK